jgi:hypothetical protein
VVDARDFRCRNHILILVAPREHDDGEGADRAYGDHPPDVSDQGKTHDGGEERADEAGRRIARDLDISMLRLFVGPSLLARSFFELPKGVFARYLGQESNIERRI